MASRSTRPATAKPMARTTPAARRPRKLARPVAAGDTAPRLRPAALESFAAREAEKAAEGAQLAAVQSVLDSAQSGRDKAKALRALLDGASSDDLKAIRKRLLGNDREGQKIAEQNPDDELADNWRDGGYPYKNLMLRRNYEQQKYRLQVELLKLQADMPLHYVRREDYVQSTATIMAKLDAISLRFENVLLQRGKNHE